MKFLFIIILSVREKCFTPLKSVAKGGKKSQTKYLPYFSLCLKFLKFVIPYGNQRETDTTVLYYSKGPQ